MNLRWKPFERRLGARLRPYDARRHMRFWQRVDHFLNSSPTVPPWLVRGLASLGLAGVVVSHAGSIRGDPDLALAALGLWGVLVSAFRAQLWNNAPLLPGCRALWILPLSANGIFDHLARQLVAGAGWLFAEFLLVYGILAGPAHAGLGLVAAALLVALSQAALSAVLAMLLATWRIKADWILALSLLLGAVLAACSSPRTEHVLTEALYRCNPFGWLNAIYWKACVGGEVQAWWGLIPLLGISATLPFSWRRRQCLHYQQALRPLPERPRGMVAAWGRAASPEQPSRAEQLRRIGTGEFLRRFAWNQCGIVERLIARVLTPRERVIAEMFPPARPQWSRRFLRVLAWLGLYVLVSTGVPFASLDEMAVSVMSRRAGAWPGVAAFFVSFVIFAVMAAEVAALFFGFAWLESAPTSSPSQTRPYRAYRLLPLNYWETATVTAKINTVVFILLLPIASILPSLPVYQMVLRDCPHAALLAPKCLLALWGTSLLVGSEKLAPALEEGLRYWRCGLKRLLVFAAWCAMSAGLMGSRNLALDLCLGGLWLIGPAAWLIYSGSLYRRAAGGRAPGEIQN